MTNEIQSKIARLELISANCKEIQEQYEQERNLVIPLEVKANLESLENEFSPKLEYWQGEINALTAEIKADVTAAKTTVHGASIICVYTAFTRSVKADDVEALANGLHKFADLLIDNILQKFNQYNLGGDTTEISVASLSIMQSEIIKHHHDLADKIRGLVTKSEPSAKIMVKKAKR